MNEHDKEIYRKAKILREGITDEALNILIDEFEFNKPIFQTRDKFGNRVKIDNFELFKFEGIRRDGSHNVIKFILSMRKIKPKQP